MKINRLRKILSMVLAVVLLVTSVTFSGLTSQQTLAATAYYPTLSFNLGNLSDENTHLAKLQPKGHNAETTSMCSISMAGYQVFCMLESGSLSRYNAFYKADIDKYGNSYQKYFRGVIYYYEDENDEFSLGTKARYVVSQIMLWRILQIRSNDKSGTYNNIMNGFENTFKDIMKYWGEANANTAWDEIKTVMQWVNNGVDKVSSKYVELHLWTHADGTQPLLAGDVTVPDKAYISVQKEGSINNAIVKNAKFGIYSKKACNDDSHICTITTDDSGYAITSKSQAKKLKPSTTYYVKEIQAPAGSKLNDKVFKVKTSNSTTAKKAVKLTVTDEQYRIKINTVKVSSKDNTKKLSGATFRVYQWNADSKKYVTYKDYTTGDYGDFTTEWLYYTKSNLGKYRLEEIKAPDKYKLTGYKRDIQISEKYSDQTIVYIAPNEPLPGWIEINKKAFAGDKDVSSEENLTATFGVYSDEACSKKVTDIRTDSSGYGKSIYLDEGTYYVKETGWSYGLTPAVTTAEPVYVRAGTASRINGNKTGLAGQIPFPIGIKLKKVDAYDNSLALEGAKFDIYEWNGVSWSLKYSEKTNEEGIVEIPAKDNKLYYTKTNLGKFRVVEREAPAGYIVDPTPRYVTITKDNKDTTVDLGEFKNTPKGGNLEIKKIIVDAKNNKVTDLPMNDSLLNITYGLYTDEACTNTVNDSIKLDENGHAKIEDLRPGVYYLKETRANGSIFAATGSLNERYIAVTINTGMTTYVDGELGYSYDNETWTDCWSGQVTSSLTGTVSATDSLIASEIAGAYSVFGTRQYTVVSDEENKKTINDISDTWKEYPDEKLDEIIGNSEDADLAEFLISLSDNDLELILSKNTRLTQPYTTYQVKDEETGELEAVSEEIYWEYLMSLPYRPAVMSTLTSRTGYFNVVITGDGKTTNMKITTTFSGTNTTGDSVGVTYSASGTNNHWFRLLTTSGQTEGAVGGNYNIINVRFSYTHPAHYMGTTSISGNYPGHACAWTEGDFSHYAENQSVVTGVQMNVSNVGVRDVGNYHATMTLNLKKTYGGLKIDPNGGIWQNSASASYKSTACGYEYPLENPTRTGYTFNGWIEDSRGMLSKGHLKSEDVTSADNRKFIFCGDSTSQLPYSPSVPNSTQLMYYSTIHADWVPNKYPVTCIDVVGTDENGKEIGRSTWQADFDTQVKGSEKGSSTILGAYYPGYYYAGYSSAMVTTEGATVYRYFTKSPSPVNEPNLLKNVLKAIELDIIKTDSEDETKTLDATFDVLEYSDAAGDYVPYLTDVKSHERITLKYNPDNTKGKFKVEEKTVEEGYTMSGTYTTISLSEGVTLPYYENLLGVDEDLGVFVMGRGYNAGDIVRDKADTDSATWYQCLISNVDKNLTNTTYWKKLTSGNFTRYKDLVNGAGVWNEKLDTVTAMAVQFINDPPSPGYTNIYINKHNEDGDILSGAKFVAYYSDGTKCADFELPDRGTQYKVEGIDISDTQTHGTAINSSGLLRRLVLTIKEEKAPYGYKKTGDIRVTINSKLSNGEWTVTSKRATFADGTEQNITSGIALDVVDEDIKLNIYLSKKSSDATLPVSSLEGAVYGIYDNEACTSLVKEVTINKNGTAAVTGITLKDYWIKEISAPESGLYKLSDEVKHVDASALYDGESSVSTVNAYVTVTDTPYIGEILVKKYGYTDSTYTQTVYLENAGFTLYKMPDIPEGSDENTYVTSYDFSKETPVRKEVKTDKEGNARFKDLVMGDYVLVETTAPDGYLKAENKVIHLTRSYAGNTDETAYPVIVYDEPYTAPVRIYKVNARDRKEYLEGAVFKIFDVNVGGYIAETVYGIDDNGNITETLEEKLYTTDEEGLAITEQLPDGTYRIEEVSAPYGYILNEKTVEVTIGEGKETGFDENGYPYYEVVIENTPTDTSFTKADITTKEEISGGYYKVTDQAGNVIDEWEGDGKAHHVYGLVPKEEYTFMEETAPDGYVVAESITFTVNEDGSPTEVVMYDDYNKVQISKQDLTTGEELPGAKLQVIDENGKVIEEWTSTDKPHRIDRLKVGTYTLRETMAPEGYILSEDVTFEVGESEEIQEVVMYDDYTKTAFIKLAEDTQEPLKGCVLQVKDLTGNVIDKWTTDGEIHYTYKLTKDETYILHEVSAPDGYELAEDIRFVAGSQTEEDEEIVDKEGIGIEDDSHIKEEEDTIVDMDTDVVTDENADPDDGLEYEETETEDVEDEDIDEGFNASEVITVTMTDSPLEIIPLKVDENGNDVTGAYLQILDKNGEVVYDWETGVLTAQGFKVVPGEYTIHEVSAPAGYQLVEDTKVTVTDKDVTVKLVDHTMKATISKVDEDGKFLKGAVLQVLDETGVKVAEWTSGDGAYVMSNLIAGATYTLHEVAAPEGYILADDVTFTMDGYDVKVIMVDKKTDLTVKKVNPLGFGIDGAKLQITDSDGKVVKEFTSSSKGNNFRGLAKGEYTLHEVSAPDGYDLSEDVKFEVTDESTTVKMVDEFTNLKLPLTGGTPLNMLLLGLPLILLGIAGFIFGRRRKTDTQQG